MKQYIRISIVLVILAFLGYMAYAINRKLLEKEALRERISTIPSFRFERLEDGFFTENDLAENKSLVFLYFNSTCDFCRLEAKAIQGRIEEFDAVQLVFVSIEEKVDIKNFAEEHDLYENTNVVFLQDSRMEFSRIFGVNSVPATFFYNKNGKLVNQFNGAVRADSMLEALQE